MFAAVLALGCALMGPAARAELEVSATPSRPIELVSEETPFEGFGLALASSGTERLAVYRDNVRGIMARFVASDGSGLGEAFLVSSSGVLPWYSVQVAFDGSVFNVLWHDTKTDYYLQAIDTQGRLVGSVQTLEYIEGGRAAIASQGSFALVVQCGGPVDGPTGECRSYRLQDGALSLSDQRLFAGRFGGVEGLTYAHGIWVVVGRVDTQPFPLAAHPASWFIRLAENGAFLDDPIVADSNAENGVRVGAISAGFVINTTGGVTADGLEKPLHSSLSSFDLDGQRRATVVLAEPYDYAELFLQATSAGLMAVKKTCTECAFSKVVFSMFDDELAETQRLTTYELSSGPSASVVDGDGVLVGWQSRDGEVRLQRVALAPLKLEGDGGAVAPFVMRSQFDARAGAGTDRWLLAWRESTDVMSTFIDLQGERAAEPFVLGASNTWRVFAVSGGSVGWLAAWDAPRETQLRFVSAAGELGAKGTLPKAAHVRLAHAGVGWLSISAQESLEGYRVFATPINGQGEPLEPTELAGPSAEVPGVDVDADGDGYRAFWTVQGALWTQSFAADGSTRGQADKVLATGVPWPLGRFGAAVWGPYSWVVWQNQVNTVSGSLALPDNDTPTPFLVNASEPSEPVAIGGFAMVATNETMLYAAEANGRFQDNPLEGAKDTGYTVRMSEPIGKQVLVTKHRTAGGRWSISRLYTSVATFSGDFVADPGSAGAGAGGDLGTSGAGEGGANTGGGSASGGSSNDDSSDGGCRFSRANPMGAAAAWALLLALSAVRRRKSRH